MTHHHSHGSGMALLAIVAAIAFAFGARTARIVVGGTLIAGSVFFGYIIFRVVAGMM